MWYVFNSPKDFNDNRMSSPKDFNDNRINHSISIFAQRALTLNVYEEN